jgi:septal ring factor EnvC (AmiA/AmiB activator)
VDLTDGNLLRAQVTAAGIAINVQLRADEARLKVKVQTDALQNLLERIEEESAGRRRRSAPRSVCQRSGGRMATARRSSARKKTAPPRANSAEPCEGCGRAKRACLAPTQTVTRNPDVSLTASRNPPLPSLS